MLRCSEILSALERVIGRREIGLYGCCGLLMDTMRTGRSLVVVALLHRGGVLGDEGETDGFAPMFRVGEQRLLFLSRRSDSAPD